MNAVRVGYGDFATWGGRHHEPTDNDMAYEAWRENVAIVDAIGADKASEILELLWSGDKNRAAALLAIAYSKAWDVALKQRSESADD